MPPFQNARVVCILKWQMLNSWSVFGGLLGLFTGRKYYELWRVSKKNVLPTLPWGYNKHMQSTSSSICVNPLTIVLLLKAYWTICMGVNSEKYGECFPHKSPPTLPGAYIKLGAAKLYRNLRIVTSPTACYEYFHWSQWLIPASLMRLWIFQWNDDV